MVASAANKWGIADTVMTGTIMAALDASIVNVALAESIATVDLRSIGRGSPGSKFFCIGVMSE
jgi:hypothetical protein